MPPTRGPRRRARSTAACRQVGQRSSLAPRPSWCPFVDPWNRPTILRPAVAETHLGSGLLNHYLRLEQNPPPPPLRLRPLTSTVRGFQWPGVSKPRCARAESPCLPALEQPD